MAVRDVSHVERGSRDLHVLERRGTRLDCAPSQRR
jgi:hypothetical protein